MVSSLVVGSSGWSGLGIKVTLDSESSSGFTSGGQSSEFSVFVLGSDDPVDSWVVSDGVVSGVNEDNFVVFIDTILTNPIAVQDSQSSKSSTNSFLGLRSKISGWLELVDTD